MWDEFGLDSLVDISGRRSAFNMGVLAGKDFRELPSMQELQSRSLRARFNPQRCYELYFLTCEESILEEDIRDMFDDHPQEIVNMIRSHGVKLVSNRNLVKRVIE